MADVLNGFGVDEETDQLARQADMKWKLHHHKGDHAEFILWYNGSERAVVTKGRMSDGQPFVGYAIMGDEDLELVVKAYGPKATYGAMWDLIHSVENYIFYNKVIIITKN